MVGKLSPRETEESKIKTLQILGVPEKNCNFLPIHHTVKPAAAKCYVTASGIYINGLSKNHQALKEHLR